MVKSIGFLRFGTIFLLAVLCLSCTTIPKNEPEVDIVAVAKVWDAYAIAVSTSNVESFSSLWTENAVKMIPDAPVIIGKNDITAMFRTKLAASSSQMTIQPLETKIMGDMAYSRGSYEQVFLPPGGTQRMKLVGKFLDILQRQPDGSWKITHDCFNFDGSPSPVID